MEGKSHDLYCQWKAICLYRAGGGGLVGAVWGDVLGLASHVKAFLSPTTLLVEATQASFQYGTVSTK